MTTLAIEMTTNDQVYDWASIQPAVKRESHRLAEARTNMIQAQDDYDKVADELEGSQWGVTAILDAASRMHEATQAFYEVYAKEMGEGND